MASLPPAKKTGSGFTNLQRILQANRGSQLGSTLANRAQQDIQGVQGGLGKANDTFKQEVSNQALNTGANEQSRTEGINAAKSATNIGEVQNKLAPAPGTDYAEQFKKFRAGEYKGPTELAQGNQYLNQAQDLNQLGRGVNTSEGRFGLLQRYIGSPQYNTGEKRLDNLILTQQADPLKQIRQNTANLATGVQSNLAQNQALAQLQAQANQNFGNQTRSLLGINDQGLVQAGQGEIGGLQKTLTDQFNQGLINKKNQVDPIIDALRRRSLTPQQLQAIGLNDTYNNKTIYGTNPSDYFSTQNDPNLNQFTSAKDAASLQALSKLAGINETFLSDPNAAGTYDPSKNTVFNKNQFDTDVNKGQQNYQAQTSKNAGEYGIYNPYGDTNANQKDTLQQAYDKALSLEKQWKKIPNYDTSPAFTNERNYVQNVRNKMDQVRTSSGAYNKLNKIF